MEYSDFVNRPITSAALQEPAIDAMGVDHEETPGDRPESMPTVIPEKFRNYSELLVARFCIKSHLPNSTIKDLLAMLSDESFNAKDVMFESPKAVLEPVDDSATEIQKFEPRFLDGYDIPIKLYRRNGLDLAKKIISAKRYADMIFSSAGVDVGHECYAGIESGTWWQAQRPRIQQLKDDLQAQLDQQGQGEVCDGVVHLPILVSSDATNISFSGSKKAHNVFMTFLNMSIEERRHLDW
jgi:hypothetical protein